jgi:DNA-binding transcriptional LysR family regulator
MGYNRNMHITLKQLEAFSTVANTLSFTHAAKVLNMSQPAVSAQINNLEEQLGIKLFEYVGKSLTLTDAGRDIASKVVALQNKVEIFKQSTAYIKGTLVGNLRISIPAVALAQSFVILKNFHDHYPQVTVDVSVADRATQLALLRDHLIDVCIMGMLPHKSSLSYDTIFSYNAVIIAPPQHPLAHKPNITLEEIRHETFLVGEKHTNLRQILEEKIITKDTKLITINNTNAMKYAVEAGLGLAVIATCTLDKALYDKYYTVLDVVGFPIPASIHLVYPNKKNPSPVTLAFKKLALRANDANHP